MQMQGDGTAAAAGGSFGRCVILPASVEMHAARAANSQPVVAPTVPNMGWRQRRQRE